LQWVIDVGPFIDYGKTDKPGSYDGSFLATNKNFIVTRAMQFLETAAYMYLSSSNEMIN